VLGRYAMIRTCSTALSGFLCGGGVIKTSLARDLSVIGIFSLRGGEGQVDARLAR
jgi:hypothetical protein